MPFPALAILSHIALDAVSPMPSVKIRRGALAALRRISVVTICGTLVSFDFKAIIKTRCKFPFHTTYLSVGENKECGWHGFISLREYVQES